MLSRRAFGAALPLLATALYLRPALADPQVQRASRPLMGTQLDITVQAPDAEQRQLALQAAFAEMERLAGMMSRYRADSLVAALQRAAGREAVPLPAEMFAVLQMAKAMAQRSGGAFDPSIGALAEWNFDPARPAMPTPEQLARELPLVDHRDLLLDERASTARLRRAGMRLDLGGIAKLPILAAGMQTLRRHGIEHAMLNGGGDVLVSGQLQGRDWRIGLRDPRAPAQLLGTLALSEGWVAASGDYERCFERAGRRYHHILDPHSGQPSQGPHGVVLVARRMEAINGLGAAIMVAGADAGRRWLAQTPEVDALIAGRDGGLWRSAGMVRRLAAA
jgi:thiamine biosynthesis lipoprotein